MSASTLPKNWMAPGYDGRFIKRAGAFGNSQIGGVKFGTPWITKYLYLRTILDMPTTEHGKLVLRHIHDDDAWIFLNGKQLDLRPGSAKGYLSGYAHQYGDLPLTPEQQALFQSGKNTLCVHCIQTIGPQVLDIGIKIVEPNLDNFEVLNDMAWRMATSSVAKQRNGKQAVELARKACTLTDFKEPMHLDTLAAAYAEAGDFSQAKVWQERAMEMAGANPKDDYRARLDLYKAGKPCRN